MGFGTNIDSNLNPQGIRALNQSGEEIPPFAMVQFIPVSGTAGTEYVGQTAHTPPVTFFGVDKYDSAVESTVYGFNGPAPVPISKYGVFQLAIAVPTLAMLKVGIDFDDAWKLGVGPVNGQWYLDAGGDFTFGGAFTGFPLPQVGFVLRSNCCGPKRIQFEIDSWDYETRIATCIVRNKMFAGDPPGEDELGMVEVHDPACCVFTDDTEAGMWGWADWMIQHEGIDGSADCVGQEAEDYPEFRWIASGRCCASE